VLLSPSIRLRVPVAGAVDRREPLRRLDGCHGGPVF
jgi:hypothetical protein